MGDDYNLESLMGEDEVYISSSDAQKFFSEGLGAISYFIKEDGKIMNKNEIAELQKSNAQEFMDNYQKVEQMYKSYTFIDRCKRDKLISGKRVESDRYEVYTDDSANDLNPTSPEEAVGYLIQQFATYLNKGTCSVPSFFKTAMGSRILKNKKLCSNKEYAQIMEQRNKGNIKPMLDKFDIINMELKGNSSKYFNKILANSVEVYQKNLVKDGNCYLSWNAGDAAAIREGADKEAAYQLRRLTYAFPDLRSDAEAFKILGIDLAANGKSNILVDTSRNVSAAVDSGY